MREWSDDSEKEAEQERFFAPWAEAMVRAEVSRGMLDEMWERIKVRLDDLHRVEQLLVEAFGANAEMVDEDSITQPEQEK